MMVLALSSYLLRGQKRKGYSVRAVSIMARKK
jgi:hypothetical protein